MHDIQTYLSTSTDSAGFDCINAKAVVRFLQAQIPRAVVLNENNFVVRQRNERRGDRYN